jgi:hypothetical protein
MASLFSQPYISPPDYDTEEFLSKKEILLVQQSAVDEYERCGKGKAMAWQEVWPQQVDAGGMGMMSNALLIPECAVELQLRLCVEAHCCSAGHRADEASRCGSLGCRPRTARRQFGLWSHWPTNLKRFYLCLAQSRSMWRGQRWPWMSRSLCRTVCTVSRLFLETKCRAH